MFTRLLLLLMLLSTNSLYAIENIGFLTSPKNNGLMENSEALKPKQNVIQVLESFHVNPMIIDYESLVDWHTVEKLSEKKVEKIVQNELKKFLKKNNITKIVLGGDSYNYNVVPFHTDPRRPLFTKAIAKMEKEGKIKIFGICGGMQGILWANNIKLATVESMIGKEKAEKYFSAERYLIDDKYSEETKRFQSCDTPFIKVTINRKSHLGELMKTAEKKYKIKYTRGENKNLVTEVPSAHHNAVNSLDTENLKHMKDKGFNIIGESEDKLIYLTEGKKNKDILIEGHPELLANVLRCQNFSRESTIFARLLFWDFLNDHKQSKLPKSLLEISDH